MGNQPLQKTKRLFHVVSMPLSCMVLYFICVKASADALLWKVLYMQAHCFFQSNEFVYHLIFYIVPFGFIKQSSGFNHCLNIVLFSPFLEIPN